MNERDQIKKYIWALTRKLGLTPSELARKAGVTPSTLTRFLNKDVKYMLSASTLAKIATAAGEPNFFLTALSEKDMTVNLVLDAVEIVEQFLSKKNISLPPYKKRQLIKTVYEAAMEDKITNPDKEIDFSKYQVFLKKAVNS